MSINRSTVSKDMGTLGVKSYFWPMQTQKSDLKQRNSFFLQDKKSGR